MTPRWRRSDRQGKLDERKGELDVELGAEWHSDDDKLMYVNFVNSNDYPVRLTELRIGTEPTGAFLRTAPLGAYGSSAFYTSPEQLGLRTSLVPAHDSLTHRWHGAELDEMLGDMEFRPGYAATVRAGNSLGHWCSARKEIEDATLLFKGVFFPGDTLSPDGEIIRADESMRGQPDPPPEELAGQD